MILVIEDIEDRGTGDEKAELREKHYPSVEIAEASVKQALLRHKIKIDRLMPRTEKEKVRL